MIRIITRRNFVAGSLLFGSAAVLEHFREPLLTAGGLAALPQVSSQSAAADPVLRDNLVAAYRILAQQGVLDGFGHVSARHNRSPDRFIMSRSLAPELVKTTDLIEFDLDGNAIDAKGR